jgi:hypothetical protein
MELNVVSVFQESFRNPIYPFGARHAREVACDRSRITKERAPQGRPEAQIRHWQKRKTVHILCSLPLDLSVDELVTWKQLTGPPADCPTGGMLRAGLGRAAVGGQGDEPTVPSLWAMPKAAERSLAKTPQRLIEII